MASRPQANTASALSFTLFYTTGTPHFGPRLGNTVFRRNGTMPNLDIDTPSFLATTSRGVVPHLSRDHRNITNIRWVHVPFETFLENMPPVPTLQPGRNPLHTFLGYPLAQQVLSMSIRDAYDGREMPPNGNGSISAYCVRGVRKVTPPEWRSYVLACKPDVVLALSDTPFTKPPHSQKRLAKSIERSASWLMDILRPISPVANEEDAEPLNVLVHMAGGSSILARQAFSDRLMEALDEKEAEAVRPFKCLDQGVSGYVFDLVPLCLSLKTDDSDKDNPTNVLDSQRPPSPTRPNSSEMYPFLRASLNPLPRNKLRLVNSACSPHEMLRLIQHIGIDLFDAHWVQRAADIGIALDFRFPVGVRNEDEGRVSRTNRNGRRDLGHNLYDTGYAHDFSRLAECFLDGLSANTSDDGDGGTGLQVCPCAACSPTSPSTRILHSLLDTKSTSTTTEADPVGPPFTRAYLHHLLQTHEMSAHSLLVMHNVAVLDAFFTGVRSVLGRIHSDGSDVAAEFAKEVERFANEYDEEMVVFDKARINWREVETARGKGRLAREREKQEQLGTVVEL